MVYLKAVDNFVAIANSTLEYIETKVMNSYKESVSIGENYDKDAMYIRVCLKTKYCERTEF
ncbi:hypothetical protein [Clostridium sp. BJN0013]|uniref:hypothetical protein n=1 Tax=Clostridium sp. BJN0013 TaxID=3236840 RepID=UPI0034C650FB